ncbi:hypothetical protein GCM10027429_26220 [Marivirga atlantica]|jgi:murein DD-endopeptidase MepM/ murein hydrolase activator NlpD|uniref:N-acetylmuramoyl-L-alanine amidase n=1 Tax=Marivirga atlantica TaxID=1548457 RepID=A0A937A9D0_9BACT|nr:N-acetylmuramoyl-L-alanine amidase [Marivirga atlantica]MBL0766222.1 N-acetylmuramoyl-L-alanine amidase [Marivirga atlantica]
MNELLIYLIKVIGIQGLAFLLYKFFLHKSGRHALNRIFVLTVLLFSFTVPLISLPNLSEQIQILPHEKAEYFFTEIESTFEAKHLIPITTKSEKSISLVSFLFWVIPIISLVLVTKLLMNYYQILRIKKKSITVHESWYFLHKSPYKVPFSFFKDVYIPSNLFKAEAFQQILTHECAHVKKYHSVDRLIMEVLITLLWFNPFLYLFRKLLIELHEFQADAYVLEKEVDTVDYMETLYHQSSGSLSVAIVNHFNFLTLKNRIKMMNANKKTSLWVYSFSLPVLLLLTVFFSHNEKIEALEILNPDMEALLTDETVSDNYIPSILPLRNTEKVKLTSAFGPRIHPKLKVQKHHQGVDFRTPVGNAVLATANGEVIEAAKIGDYGLKVIIDHNGTYQTAFAHLSQIKVKKGDKVNRGEVIALSGNSGASFGPHLHYEVIDANQGHVDPLPFIHDFAFKSELVQEANKNSDTKKRKLKVVIDPGHGGRDAGTHSSGQDEKDIVLDVAQELAILFENSKEVDIVLTRKADEMKSLAERIAMSEDADMFISLHVERHEDKMEDMLVPIYNDLGEFEAASKRFAQLLTEEFNGVGKNIRPAYSSGYYVLKNAKCPPVLFNIGYVSNADSDLYLNSKDGKKEIAQEIADAILRLNP